MKTKDNYFIRKFSELNDSQQTIILRMINSICIPVKGLRKKESDIVSDRFYDYLSYILLIHHALHEEKFNKKSFEYAVKLASEFDNKIAELTKNSNHPGVDLIINEIKYSLKTEASSSIDPNFIHISKFMEARWIRDCNTKADYATNTVNKFKAHLKDYDRIIIFRAFATENDSVTYEMVEIPKTLLTLIFNLKPKDFDERTPNGSTKAAISINDEIVYYVRLDGSVEKVTISKISIKHCIKHATWIIPLQDINDWLP